ncbi:hypothetical protein GCM10012284_22700 [Mangrovihabitans endophyticus]|uniref:Uncharacterized protein n=1 Tax=Mangrovihabitans endophyticus TaxID=1751298 RepID=A0A8J3FNM4_9ACTN|nr:hypothetical protein GCM10012284_22700 [Mangrovihabitans endophyticus]
MARSMYGLAGRLRRVLPPPDAGATAPWRYADVERAAHELVQHLDEPDGVPGQTAMLMFAPQSSTTTCSPSVGV